MIRGAFHPLQHPDGDYKRQPSVWADIIFPRFNRGMEGRRFLIDTGGDRTTISVGDAYYTLGGLYFWEVQSRVSSDSVRQAGGQLAGFHSVKATVGLHRDDGNLDSWELCVQIPAIDCPDDLTTREQRDKWLSNELKQGMENHPNILGRDILCGYVLTVGYHPDTVTLGLVDEHNVEYHNI